MSTFDPYAAGSQGGYTTFTAGKMLGGSDSLNHLVHTRGCSSDFDTWAEIAGDESWTYNNLLKYFIKSERLDDQETLRAYPEYHGTTGPMGLTREPSKKLSKYLQAFEEIGHPTILDLNADICIGYTQPQYTIADKIRQTPAYSYLKFVKNNPNLYVSINTKVTRIIFKNKVAIAVEAVYNGNTYILCANKEIILSAGSFNTAQLLLLSGVGPEDHLKEMGINTISNLPVGYNFIEQVAIILVFKTLKYIPTIINVLGLQTDITMFPFPLFAGSVALNKSQKFPDYQTFNGLCAHDTPYLTLVCHDTFWYRNDICDSWQKQVSGHDSLITLLTNVMPKSKSRISLRSTNSFDPPVIKTNFLTDEQDLDNMVKYVKDFIEIRKSRFYKSIGAEIVGIDLPECANQRHYSDEFWKCYIRNRAIAPFHYTGSCSLGSVVDNKLQLIGFKRIRIIDGSILPYTLKGGPNAAIIAMAEKGADLLMNDSCY